MQCLASKLMLLLCILLIYLAKGAMCKNFGRKRSKLYLNDQQNVEVMNVFYVLLKSMFSQ